MNRDAFEGRAATVTGRAAAMIARLASAEDAIAAAAMFDLPGGRRIEARFPAGNFDYKGLLLRGIF